MKGGGCRDSEVEETRTQWAAGAQEAESNSMVGRNRQLSFSGAKEPPHSLT